MKVRFYTTEHTELSKLVDTASALRVRIRIKGRSQGEDFYEEADNVARLLQGLALSMLLKEKRRINDFQKTKGLKSTT